MMINELKDHCRRVLVGMTPNAEKYVDMLQRSHRPGVDYQANFCMALGKELGRPPREVAQEIVNKLECKQQ